MAEDHAPHVPVVFLASERASQERSGPVRFEVFGADAENVNALRRAVRGEVTPHFPIRVQDTDRRESVHLVADVHQVPA